MKPCPNCRGFKAFTLVELLCVAAMIGLLAAVLLPSLNRSRMQVLRVQCVSNLRQFGTAFHAFAHDHNGSFPMAAAVDLENAPRPRDFFPPRVAPAAAVRFFQAASAELLTPRILICPADSRQPAGGFQTLQYSNISFFLGVEANLDHPGSILGGDRNLTNDWLPNLSVARLGSQHFLRWTHELHRFKGNLLFADAHVEQMNSPNLLAVSARSGPPAVLLLPNPGEREPPRDSPLQPAKFLKPAPSVGLSHQPITGEWRAESGWSGSTSRQTMSPAPEPFKKGDVHHPEEKLAPRAAPRSGMKEIPAPMPLPNPNLWALWLLFALLLAVSILAVSRVWQKRSAAVRFQSSPRSVNSSSSSPR